MPGDESGSTAQTKADAKAAAAKARQDRSDAIDAAMASWVGDHINNSPVSQHQNVYAHVLDRLPALRDAILNLGE